MKLSACVLGSIERLEHTKNAGIKYIEPGVVDLNNFDDEQFTGFAEKIKEYKLECISANRLFPGTIKLLDGKEYYSEIEEYLDKNFARLKQIGVDKAILGSGGARNIPESMSRELAKERFADVITNVICKYANKYNLIVGLEELRATETNFINNCKEAVEIIKYINNSNFKLLLDYFHSILGGDTIEELANFKDSIIHVHIASPKHNRLIPREDEYEEMKAFMSMLKEIDYTEGVSVEASFEDFGKDVQYYADYMNKILTEI